jgi:hypothetical protein
MRYHRDVSAGCWCGVEVEVEVCCLGILKHSRRSRILTLCADHSSLCSHLHILLPDARYSISYSRSNLSDAAWVMLCSSTLRKACLRASLLGSQLMPQRAVGLD